jgi:hypothetical protein
MNLEMLEQGGHKAAEPALKPQFTSLCPAATAADTRAGCKSAGNLGTVNAACLAPTPRAWE